MTGNSWPFASAEMGIISLYVALEDLRKMNWCKWTISAKGFQNHPPAVSFFVAFQVTWEYKVRVRVEAVVKYYTYLKRLKRWKHS